MEEGSSSSPSSSSSSSTILLTGGGRAIDRHNPIIRDSRRISKSLPPCTTTHPPISPKPQKAYHKKKKNNKKVPFKENEEQREKTGSSSDLNLDCETIKNSNGTSKNDGNGSDSAVTVSKSWSCTKPDDFISPPGSTRFLLRDKVSFNALSDFDPAEKSSLEETSKSEDEKTEELCVEKPPSSSPTPDQVVVLRVSLHCRGCERKLRKHLSRLEGVTSFHIDFTAKKVTVTGNVTPVGVLSSISKVKNAQLWSPTISSSSSIPPSDNLSNSESKNDYKEAGA